VLADAAMRKLVLVSPLCAIVACSGSSAPTAEDAAPPVLAVPAAHFDTSPPLRDLVATPAVAHRHDEDEGDYDRGVVDGARARAIDPVAQRTIAAAVAPTPIVDVESLGAGYPAGVYNYPPDTVSAVGTTQIVTIVNSSFAVWDKTGHMIYGPKPTNTIFAGFGGNCETTNDGDAKVRWDSLAQRWVVSDFSYFTAPYGACVAVSATADATGAWHRYFFQFNSPTDQPTIGVWSDAYYLQINGLLPGDNLDVPICALDRAAMLAGTAATRQCFSTGARGGTPTPGDLVGPTAPPSGEPDLIVSVDRGNGAQLNTWKLHVDWSTPANSALTGPTPVAVAPFVAPQVSVTQPGTTQLITPGGNTFPLTYRNFGDHEAFVATDVVDAGGVNGVRWYELRWTAGGALSVYQQGTFAPGDGVHRFMPSNSIDKYGNIAIGYSVSSSTVSPGIRVTGRVATDPLGQLTQGEGVIVNGAGAQTGTNRWGDYSSMSVDPSDDCTFWYSQEYTGEVSSASWRTRLASFRLPGCAASPPPTGIVNGDFETGALAPWTTTGSTSITTTAHGGSKAAMVGLTGPTTDSSIAQSFTAPAAGGTLSFWYRVTCPDSVSYDWATATLADTTASTTTTILPKTCTNTGAWVQVSATLVAGHNYTLTLANHDDNYAGDATYTIYDDVTIGSAPPPPPSGIVNGGFETGAFTPWTTTGTTSIATTAHTGSYAAVAGKVGATTKGDSTIVQTFAAPSTGGTLAFYYKVVCLDSLTYDWATATLKDVTAGTSKTILAKTCSNTGAWAQASAALVASHTYTLTLVSHDDGYSNADATYTLFDDATIK
jgi:hypothetical protein